MIPAPPESTREEFGAKSLLAVTIESGGRPAGRVLLFNPAPETVIRASDTLIVIGADSHLKKLEALATA